MFFIKNFSNIYLWMILFFVWGIFSGSFGFYYAFLFCFVFFVFNQKWTLFLLLVPCFVAGYLYVDLNIVKTESFENFYNRNLEIKGSVHSKKLGLNKNRYLIKISEIEDELIEEEVYLSLRLFLYPELSEGSSIILNCFFEKKSPESFSYKAYFIKNKIIAECQSPKITSKNDSKINPSFGAMELLEQKIRSIFHEPYASLMMAMFFGDKDGLLPEFNEQLSKVGLSHIFVISGLHITILAGIFLKVIGFFPLKKRNQIFSVIVLLFFYLFLIGFPPSAVRGVIMGSLGFLSSTLGRSYKKLNSLLTAVFLMLLFNPLLLVFDIGFQLSFAATIGILYLNPMLTSFVEVKNSFLKNVFEVCCITVSATFFTNPLIFFYFKQLSLIALFSNLIVSPIVSFLLFLGVLMIVTSLISVVFASYIGILVHFLITFVLAVVFSFSNLSFSSIDFEISVLEMLFLYSGLFFIYFIFSKYEKNNFFND